MATETSQRIPLRERRPSMGAPIVDIHGSIGPAGVSRPKHKRTFTGFGAGEIKNVEGKTSSELQSYLRERSSPQVEEAKGHTCSALLAHEHPTHMPTLKLLCIVEN